MAFWVCGHFAGLCRPLVLRLLWRAATTINDDYREAVVPDIYKAGYATLHPVDTGAAIPIYPSLAEGTSDRWARGEVQAHLDALRP